MLHAGLKPGFFGEYAAKLLYYPGLDIGYLHR